MSSTSYIIQLKSMYGLPTNPLCEITGFIVTDTLTNNVVTSGDIYTHILDGARAAAGDAITVDTTLAAGSKALNIRIQVYLGTGAYKYLNHLKYEMQVKIGCFKETSM